MISLVATDLDGTLLNSDSKVSRENREAIERASRAGIVTIAATARSARSVASIGREAGLGSIAICANGSVGYNIETDELLWHHRLPGTDTIELLAELRRRAPGFLFAAEQHKEFFSEPHFLRNEVVITGFTHVDQIETVLGEGATKIICRHP
ncbi:MAG: HAD family hydrolase, partial [Acidimicrobiales bacterium]